MTKSVDVLKNLRIGVLLGGESAEREISLRSGKAVAQALRSFGFNVVEIDPKLGLEAQLRAKPIDIAFIALHGSGGEDGQVQCFLEARGIPYTGAGSTASACAFDKYLTKMKFMAYGIPTPRFILADRFNYAEGVKLGMPLFVKPLREGSSIDTFKIESETAYTQTLQQLLKKYDQVLVEDCIDGREITVGIVGKTVLPAIELKSKNKFYDFEAKYTKGMTEYLVPADLPTDVTQKVQDIAWQVFEKMQLRDLSRVDIMLNKKNEPFVLEVNTIPGFTESSLLPKAAAHVQIDFNALCQQILSSAWERYLESPVMYRGDEGEFFNGAEAKKEVVV